MDTSVAGPSYRKRRRRTKARKDSEGQEAVIDLSAIKDRVDELISLHAAVRDASTDYSEAIKASAEKGGINARALRAYIRARASESYEKDKQYSEQLSLLFDELGGAVSSGAH
jgi:hypothetical protein